MNKENKNECCEKCKGRFFGKLADWCENCPCHSQNTMKPTEIAECFIKPYLEMKNTACPPQQIQEKLREEWNRSYCDLDFSAGHKATRISIADFWLEKLALALKERDKVIVEMIEGKKWTKENCPISKMEYGIQGVDFIKGKVEGRNQALQDISSLIKEK